jgi:hypothetical protein
MCPPECLALPSACYIPKRVADFIRAFSCKNWQTIRRRFSNVSVCPHDKHSNMLSRFGLAGPSRGVLQAPHANTSVVIGSPPWDEAAEDEGSRRFDGKSSSELSPSSRPCPDIKLTRVPREGAIHARSARLRCRGGLDEVARTEFHSLKFLNAEVCASHRRSVWVPVNALRK